MIYILVLDIKPELRYGAVSNPLFLWWGCGGCDFVTNYKSSLIRHYSVKHNGIQYTCENCERIFYCADELIGHNRNYHTRTKHSKNCIHKILIHNGPYLGHDSKKNSKTSCG